MPMTSASSVTSFKAWSALVLAAAVVVSTAGAGGCSGGSSGGGGGNVCTPGAQVSCACPGGASGAQACKSDGSGYDACDCAGGQDASVDTGSGADSGSDTIAQTGCATGQRCTWIRDQVTPTLTGHFACEANGTIALHGACSYGASGPTTGYDDCQKGLVCLAPGTEAASGTCSAICDTAATSGPGVCATNYTCGTYSAYFPTGSDAGTSTLGLCQPTCNPVTQALDYNGAAACGGGMTGGYPTLGCYGLPSSTTQPSTFTCASNPNPTYTSDYPITGTLYVNGCAAGYVPAFVQSWQSTTPICVAFCQPGNTSSTSTANATGVAGSGYTCPDRGAGGTHECRYLWWLEGQTTPITTVDDSVGLCFDYAQYKYDSNNNGTIDSGDANDPSCTTLSSTGHTFSSTQTDTQFWGCESVTSRPMFREKGGMPVIRLLDRLYR